jgi:hypothetical protein
MSSREPYDRPDPALVHHRGFGFHADLCASGTETPPVGLRTIVGRSPR